MLVKGGPAHSKKHEYGPQFNAFYCGAILIDFIHALHSYFIDNHIIVPELVKQPDISVNEWYEVKRTDDINKMKQSTVNTCTQSNGYH